MSSGQLAAFRSLTDEVCRYCDTTFPEVDFVVDPEAWFAGWTCTNCGGDNTDDYYFEQD